MEWTNKTIGDIAFVTKLAGFEHTKYIQGNCIHERKDDSFIPLFIGKTVRDGRIDKNFDWYIPKSIADQLPRSFLKRKCLVLPYVGTIGDLAVFDASYDALLGSNIAKIELNPNCGYSEEFIYYYLKSPRGQTVLLKDEQGGIQKNITMEAIRNVLLPDVDEDNQKKIVSVLSALDDKIALNKKMNQKLEAMAKRLYDYWFVQYDFPDKNGLPYKTTGGPMTYNPTLKREIPAGWEVKNVNDVTTSVRGVSYSSDDEKSKTDSNAVQILRGNNISGSRFVFDSNDVFVSSDLVAEEQKISKFDIVMTMSSGSKEHVGKSALALYDMPHSFGAFCSKFTPNEEARYFIDCYLHSEIFIKYIRQTCSGTGINNLTNGHFDKSLFAWPTEDILKAFNEKVSAIYEQRGVIEREITRLTALRDKLLTLLMNGQVVV